MYITTKETWMPLLIFWITLDTNSGKLCGRYISDSVESLIAAKADHRFSEFGLQDDRIVLQESATLRQ
jgi:hypothetical protein